MNCEIHLSLEGAILKSQNKITSTQYDNFDFAMPDGKRDAETILLTLYQRSFFLSQSERTLLALYTTAYPYSTNDTIVLRKVMVLPFTR